MARHRRWIPIVLFLAILIVLSLSLRTPTRAAPLTAALCPGLSFGADEYPAPDIRSYRAAPQSGWYVLADSQADSLDDYDDGSSTTDCDLDTGGILNPDRLRLRDRGTGGSNYLRIDTGVALGQALQTFTLRLYASQSRGPGNGVDTGSQLWSDFSRLYIFVYDTTDTVDPTSQVVLNIGTDVVPQPGPISGEGAPTEYIDLDLLPIYNAAPGGTTNLILRIIAEGGGGLDVDDGLEIRMTAEIYVQWVPAPQDTQGPAMVSGSASPNPTNGGTDVLLTATLSDAGLGDSPIAAAEFFTDSVGANGTGAPMAPVDGAFDTVTETVRATLTAAGIATLAEGDHTYYIHGQDAAGNWGGFGTVILRVDKTAPQTSNPSASPNPSDGSTPIQVTAAVSDPVSSGVNSNVSAAEFYVDVDPGAGNGTAMAASDGAFDSPSEGVNGTLDPSTLAEGSHTLYIRGQDAAGNWGLPASLTLIVDRTAPTVTVAAVSPNPAVEGWTTTVTLTATASDPISGGVNSNVTAAEYFVGAPGADGTGTPMAAADGAFDSPSEDLTATVDISTWAAGTYTFYIHAQDAAGHWGAYRTVTLQIVPPTPTLQVQAGPNRPAARTVAPPRNDEPADQWRLSAVYETVTVTQISVTFQGTNPADVTLVELWEDRDGDGTVSAGDGALGSSPLSGGVATFSGLSLPVSPGTPVDLLLTWDIAAGAGHGNTLSALFTDGDVQVTGGVVDPFSLTAPTITIDTQPPQVLSVNPADGQTGVDVWTNVVGYFTEALDPSSVTSATFTLVGPNGAVTATVSYDPNTFGAVLDPNLYLQAQTRYTATLTTGIRDRAGNPLAADYTWTFTTGTPPPTDWLQVTGQDLAPAYAGQGEPEVPLLALDLEPLTGQVEVTGLTVHLLGTAQPSDLRYVKVFQDNGNGTYDGAELLLDAKPVQAGGVVPLTFWTSLNLSAGSVTRLFLVADLPVTATLGATLGVEVTQAGDVAVTPPDQATGAFPIASGLSTISLAPARRVRATATKAPMIDVQWDPPTNATPLSYRLYVTSTSSPTPTLVVETTELRYKHSGLTLGETYYYYVVAHYATGDAPASNVAWAAVPATIDSPHSSLLNFYNACDTCHSMHGYASVRQMLPRERVDLTCYICHDGTGASAYSPSVLGEFNPTATGDAYTPGSGRVSYHRVISDVDAYTLGKFGQSYGAQSPYNDVTCTRCHNQHGYSGGRILKNPITGVITGTQYCVDCHTATGDPAAYARGGDKSGFDASAHGQAAAAGTGGFSTDPTQSGNQIGCLNCHTPHASDNPYLIARLDGTDNRIDPVDYSSAWDKEGLCFDCHSTQAVGPKGWDVQAQFSQTSRHPIDTGQVTCASCHNPHRVTDLQPVSVPTNTLQTADYTTAAGQVSFCLGCHQGRGTVLTAQVTTDTVVPYDVTIGGPAIGPYATNPDSRHRLSSGPNSGQPLPCGECHQPHGSGNVRLLNDQMPTGAVTVTDLNDPAQARAFCLGCHRTADDPNPTPTVAGVPVPKLTNFNVPADPDFHRSTSTEDCRSCHGNSYAGSWSRNVHRPGNGLGPGLGANCQTCHPEIVQGMTETGVEVYRHWMNGAADLADPTAPHTCLNCHVAHEYFYDQRAANLRADAGNLSDPEPAAAASDYLAGGGGVCLSCHQTAQTKSPGTHPDASVQTPALDPALYDASAHQYGVQSTFATDSSTFTGNCVKCHNDQGTPIRYQTGAVTFALHRNETTDPARLLDPLGGTVQTHLEENFCYACHDGGTTAGTDVYGVAAMSAASRDVKNEFNRTYRHDVAGQRGIHRPDEGIPNDFGGANRHVECADCHSPHGAAAGLHTPGDPTLAPALRGASGVTVTNGPAGTSPTYTFVATATEEYQICFKCHSGYTSQPAGQEDLGVRLNPNNPSYHPVEAQGKTYIDPGAFVNGWDSTKRVTCSDCHGTSDATGAQGPHGSDYIAILKAYYRQQSTRWMGGMRGNEICFQCHRYDVYANQNAPQSVQALSRWNPPAFRRGHTYHVDRRGYSCYSCHESHGSTQLPSLIALRAQNVNDGLWRYEQLSTGGLCWPSCHDPESYIQINYPR